MPHLSTTIIMTYVFEWHVIMCGSKNWYQKTYICLRRDQNVRSIHGNQSRLNNQHNWGGGGWVYDHLTSMMTLPFIIDHILIGASKIIVRPT
jgi:hypothetical protein